MSHPIDALAARIARHPGAPPRLHRAAEKVFRLILILGLGAFTIFAVARFLSAPGSASPSSSAPTPPAPVQPAIQPAELGLSGDERLRRLTREATWGNFLMPWTGTVARLAGTVTRPAPVTFSRVLRVATTPLPRVSPALGLAAAEVSGERFVWPYPLTSAAQTLAEVRSDIGLLPDFSQTATMDERDQILRLRRTALGQQETRLTELRLGLASMISDLRADLDVADERRGARGTELGKSLDGSLLPEVETSESAYLDASAEAARIESRVGILEKLDGDAKALAAQVAALARHIDKNYGRILTGECGATSC